MRLNASTVFPPFAVGDYIHRAFQARIKPRRRLIRMAEYPKWSTGAGCKPVASASQVRILPLPPTPHGVYGMWPSLVRRLLWEQEIAGSNPAVPTRKRPTFLLNQGVSFPSCRTLGRTEYGKRGCSAPASTHASQARKAGSTPVIRTNVHRTSVRRTWFWQPHGKSMIRPNSSNEPQILGRGIGGRRVTGRLGKPLAMV